MAGLEDLLSRAVYELACPRCQNGPGITVGNELDECPECHGEWRNTYTIELLQTLVRGAVMKPLGVAVADSAS